MKYDRFDLEQLIVKNWEVVTEIIPIVTGKQIGRAHV